jgi:hypothetical protein
MLIDSHFIPMKELLGHTDFQGLVLIRTAIESYQISIMYGEA